MALSVEAEIQKTIMKAMQFAFGKVAFEDSQIRVPVVTGELKNSGTFERTGTGFTIIYAAPYAAAVHNGQEAATTSERYVSTVRQHDRELKSGKTVRVKSHQKHYVGMKPSQIGGEGHWAVLPMKGHRKPNRFVTDALEQRMAELFNGELEKHIPTMKAEIK
jgi:hypothetical protein